MYTQQNPKNYDETYIMSDLLTFKEFMNSPDQIDEETEHTLTLLSEAHPVIKNNATIQRILKNKHTRISLSEIASINVSILQRSTQLAKQMLSADEKQRFLILAEQNLLNISAATISSTIAARIETTINKAAKLSNATRR